MSLVFPIRGSVPGDQRADWCGAMARALVLVAILLLGCCVAHAQATDAAVLSKRADDVEKCFKEKFALYAATQSSLDLRYTGLTAIFVAEQVARDARFNQGTGKVEGPLMQMSVPAYCEEVLYKPYVRTLEDALAARAKASAGGLAPFGSEDIEADSLFVQGYQDLIGRHSKGHSDIARAALETMARVQKIAVTPEAVTLVARASQTPDLYRWNDGRYHAHTPEFAAGKPDERIQSMSSGMKAFGKLVCDLSTTFVELVKVGAKEESLFMIGVIGHAVQDLEYHRGMTMSQHSGLSYVVSLNPDSPDIPKAAEIERRSIEGTVWMMQLLRGRVGNAQWQSLFKWKPLGDFSFRGTAERVYGLKGGTRVQDMKVSALASYWNLSLAYRSGERPRSELEVESCSKDGGISCWDAAEVRKQIEARLASGEACQ